MGWAESDANPWMAKACIDAPGTHTMGFSPSATSSSAPNRREIGDLWRKAYIGTAMNGRRGVVVHALSAVDIALLGSLRESCWSPCTAPSGRGHARSHRPLRLPPTGWRQLRAHRDAVCASAENAVNLGFRAIKTEITMNGPYAHDGMRESFDRHTKSWQLSGRRSVRT